MADSLGLVNYSNQEGYQKSYSDKTAKMIDQEVSKTIRRQYDECKKIISEKKDLIER